MDTSDRCQDGRGQFARAARRIACRTDPRGRRRSDCPLGGVFAARSPSWSRGCKELADQQLRKESLGLRYRARSGEPLDRLLVEAFALVREAGRRKLGMRHFDVQLLGGAAVHHRSIVEMQTGEGKTLTATLPLYLAALEGKGAHLATVNDYLARRDAEWMGPLYQALGMTVGIIQGQQPQEQRRKAYACDVTYGTANEMGFDFLRDRLLRRTLERRPAGLVRADAGRVADGAQRRAGAARACTSCWWTRPTAFSSTRPARR